MKSIKKYNEFITEKIYSEKTRSTNLDGELKTKDFNGVLELIKKKAPWYLENCENIKPIFRGLDMDYYDKDTIALRISPYRHSREASNTFNFYIELMNNSPYWSEYPKRSKSIICTTSGEKARNYGTIFRVIPLKENSTFAVCSEDDVFISFPYLSDMMKKITNAKPENKFTIKAFNNWLLMFDLDRNDNFETIKRKIEENSIKIINDDESVRQSTPNQMSMFQGYFKQAVKEGLIHIDEIIEELFRWMNPENNNFHKIEYNRNTTQSEEFNFKEVWTDDDCLLIEEMVLQSALEEHINWG